MVMNLSMCYDHWRFALLDDERNKAELLGARINSSVDYFSNVSSFMTYLSTVTNAPNHLILVVPLKLSKDLPSDIGQKVRGLFIYDPDSNNKFPSFIDLCSNLASLLVAQSVAQSFHFHRLQEKAPARYYAGYANSLMKTVEQDLQDLCDAIDEDIRLGEEANDQ